MEMLNEYLDSEYGKPLYDKLRGGKNALSSDFSIDEEMMVGLFLYFEKILPIDDYVKIGNVLKNYNFGKYTIRMTANHLGQKTLYVVDGEANRYNKIWNFIDKKKKKIYKIFLQDTTLTQYLDDFYFFMNKNKENYKILGDNTFRKFIKPEYILRFPHIEKPTWLLHFTFEKDDAVNICNHGFKNGTSVKDIDKIAFTHATDYDKNGKYCYAYNAKSVVDGNVFNPRVSKRMWAFDNASDQKVWERAMHYCVMFIGNGVSTYHMTDREEQVIFNSDTARNFVLLSFENKTKHEQDPQNYVSVSSNKENVLSWRVEDLNGNVIYDNPSFKNVVAWVMNNYDQYRKPLNKPRVDKIDNIDGVTKEELIDFAKRRYSYQGKIDQIIEIINDDFASGNICHYTRALANTFLNLSEKEYNDRINGYNVRKENTEVKKIQITETQEKLLHSLVKEGIKIHKGEKGKTYSTQGKWDDDIECPHCGERAYFTMSISDGAKGRGKIKITDEQGKEKETEVQTIALYYCPKCFKFIARNNMA